MAVSTKGTSTTFSDCRCHHRKWTELEQLKNCLPPSYDYKVCEWEEYPDGGFKTTLRLGVNSVEELKQWKSQLEQTTSATFRTSRTYPKCGLKVVFKEDYHCQHAAFQLSKKSNKNSDCLATLQLRLKRCVKYSRSTDSHLPMFPAIIALNWRHNHPLESASALKYRDVSDETREKLIDLFAKGHTPSSALDLYKSNLQLCMGEKYVFAAGDRSAVPDLQYVYRLHQKQFKDQYGESTSSDMPQRISAVLQELRETKQVTAATKITETGQLVVALITPLMCRVLIHVTQAAEMMFVDSTGNCDRHGVRVFLLLTHCSAGGVPVGCLLTSSESCATITEALQLFVTLFPEGAFGNNGFPSVIITDDCDALRQALANVFPQARLLLCIFHVLQAVWRWLWDSNHKVHKENRQDLFYRVKSMLYSSSESELETNMVKITDDCSAQPNFVEYVRKLFSRREEWALVFRKFLTVRGNNTNNYVEAAMKIFKDKVLRRTKAYNVLQLIDFVASHLEMHYIRLLTDVANGRSDTRKKSSVSHVARGILKEHITSVGGDEYLVKSETTVGKDYIVNVELGVCTCQMGQNGGGCKHQAAVVLHCDVNCLNFLPVLARDRQLFHFISTGISVHLDWFGPLQSATSSSTSRSSNPTSQGINSITSRDILEPASLSVSSEGNEMDFSENDAAASGDASREEKLANLGSRLHDFADKLIEKMKEDPENYVPAISAFLNTTEKTQNDSAEVSALHSFGKYSGLSHKGRFLSSNKRIGVQPTAIARRKLRLSGKQITKAGRPTINKCKQNCQKSREILSAVLPRRKAPHNLSSCVSNNQSLGRTHNAK